MKMLKKKSRFTTIKILLMVALLTGCSNFDPRGNETYWASVFKKVNYQSDGITTDSISSVAWQYRSGRDPFFIEPRYETKEDEVSAGRDARQAGTFWGKLVSGALGFMSGMFLSGGII